MCVPMGFYTTAVLLAVYFKGNALLVVYSACSVMNSQQGSAWQCSFYFFIV
uniref:Uncharacterized protein n=1 Tax=Anguilla anguilla TaxID=7936 RepID=A0A0E9W067_ANGAN